MYHVTFILHGFLFDLPTPDGIMARVLHRIVPHSRLWKEGKLVR
jgi:hypothetical protein